MKYFYCLLAITVLAVSCSSSKEQADSVFYNGVIITMNDTVPEASVIVIKEGKILALGGNELLDRYSCASENKHDLKGRFVYPGFIDAHCHFYGYARNLMNCDLSGTRSWNEVVSRLDTFARQHASEWVTGRGWDQNDWQDKKFPDNLLLNLKFPDRPVVLKRIDGHAVICNQRALDLAGITPETVVEGGEIIKENGRMTGVLTDNAAELVESKIARPTAAQMIASLQVAEKTCYSYGLTTLADAGLPLKDALFLDSLGRTGGLSIYLYNMLNPDEDAIRFAEEKGVIENDYCKIGSFKLYADGALGSRGAKLKKDYCDRKGHSGTLIYSPGFYDTFCSRVFATDYQLNTHCIGDSAGRLILDTYGKYLKGKNDKRWRIEHAQVTDTADLHLYGKFSIIPSVQPTHALSDAPWAADRLCESRMRGAYAYKTLLAQNGYLPLGTDFPVEGINPFHTFFTAVFRKSTSGKDGSAFYPEQALTHDQALKGMTIWAAKACKLEHRKGSLAAGKDADMAIADTDLQTAGEQEVLRIRVIATYRMGNRVFQNNELSL